jgi:phosphate starvation-inducible protein PhoH and related proteins
MIEATIPVGSADELVMLLGSSDQHLRRIRDSVPSKISARDGKIHVSGDEQAVLQATEIIEQIKNAVTRDGGVSPDQVTNIIRQVTGGPAGNGKPPLPRSM